MDDLRNHLEYIFLEEIVRGLRQKSISVEDSKKLAQVFLSIEPFASNEDAQAKIDKFCQDYPEFSTLKEYLTAYTKEQNIDAVIAKMREHIKNNNLDEALRVAKGDS
jgi:hypothetical protein